MRFRAIEFDSLPPLVKIISQGRAPILAAMMPRASSMASLPDAQPVFA